MEAKYINPKWAQPTKLLSYEEEAKLAKIENKKKEQEYLKNREELKKLPPGDNRRKWAGIDDANGNPINDKPKQRDWLAFGRAKPY